MDEQFFLTAIQVINNVVNTGTPPIAPENLQGTGLAGDIGLTWTNNDIYDTLTLERNKDSAGYTVLSSAIAGTDSSYNDNQPGAGSYVYRIKGVTGGISSTYAVSNTVVI